ncbi:toprim domain-containing protein [Methanothermococcus sp.]|uniref:toprim domain-containing protein n=1 Tax=Methanothermococcus sp. TaxID=2614238 RepID=UPI0025FC88C3|nr:toprim domain-containing protein [Methanothermococcus sp.]
MKRKEYFLKLIETIDVLKHESKNGTPILVEGKKDIASLKKLGVDGNFITVSHIPFFEIADELVKQGIKDVILLTDFDRTGKRYAREIINELESRGINVNKNIRRDIIRYSHGDLKDIESLYHYIVKNKKFKHRYGI